MAVTTVQTNNKLIQFTQDINREFVRESMYRPYMGEGLNAIIRLRQELKSGGEQMNIPLVTKLSGTGVATGVLAGNEERIDNYGMRVWLDWARHAVVTNKAENQKDSADVFGEAKPLLSDWAKELQKNEVTQQFLSLPSESSPANLGTSEGQRINGLKFEDSTAAQKNTWVSDNHDRVLFGNAISNHITTTTVASATSALSVVGTAQKLSYTIVQMLKRRAELCAPKIRPYRTEDGYEYYVLFAGSYAFRDLANDSTVVQLNRDARAREGRGMDNNPLFQDGDLLINGVIVRKAPEISTYVDGAWSATLSSGGVSGRIEPVFLCGQQAAVLAFGQMIKPTFRKEDDYGFVMGVGIEMAYGVAKMFKRHSVITPNTTSTVLNAAGLVQWGQVTGFVAALTDS